MKTSLISGVSCFNLPIIPHTAGKVNVSGQGIYALRNEKAASLHALGYRFRTYWASSAATASSHFSRYTFCTTAAVQL